ncbi:hypothetical protein FNF29_04928 [Cafeteria roenbergensis]|uniref:Uncharacterized protein n=1 Tax=Cafeteria roenbergensis TaxID=33653 RepID=A0A5A8CFZ0_CAFRO|nr:hypothetical protein FNF29_04928 [Cafeteria roenbergensis]|eukprot:KAA0151040.1 hypothetical protein FNF29_04928 [Cafeteria roenbergensis]
MRLPRPPAAGAAFLVTLVLFQLGRTGATSNSFWRATGGFVVLGADDSTVTRACISQDRVGYSWGASDGTGTTNAIVGAIKSAHCVGSLCGLSFACGDGGTSGPEALSACLQDSSCVFLNYSRGEVLLLERPLALAVCDPARSDAYAGLLLSASADVDACPDSSGVVSVALLATVSSVAVIAASLPPRPRQLARHVAQAVDASDTAVTWGASNRRPRR